MGTVVGVTESDGGMFEESIVHTMSASFSSTKHIGNPVVYKLVRVEGDGRLVPATDEEIMEVKDLFENNKSDMHIVTDSGQTVGYISDEGLSTALPQLESSEGLSQSDNTEADADRLNSRLEYIEEMLQKVKQEERLRVTHGSLMHSANVNAKSQCSNENNKFSCREDKVQSETLLQEAIPFSLKAQNGCCLNQLVKVGQSSKSVTSLKEAASSTAPQKPDFSKLRGEICLDNLSIKELQETFRATFGRETTVKDKLWLKRRIAMGLTNSCVVSTTSFTIKDNKLVGGHVENCNNAGDASSEHTKDEVRADNCKDAPTGRSDQIKGHHCASANIPGDNFMDHDCGGEDFAGEHRAAKRVRKPTRRYIEELSETDEKQQSGKSMNPSKDWRVTPKSQLRSIRAVSSGGRVVVTRIVSLAGSRIQVPFISQVRRSRPRENIMALVDFHSTQLEAKATPAENSRSLTPSQFNSDNVKRGFIFKSASEQILQEFATGPQNSKPYSGSIPVEVDQNMEPKHVDSCGNSSDNNHVSMPNPAGTFRRKHHRAWTLSEVIKLVDGVSKFGAGKWSEIRRLSFASYSYRTSVDLKDKWRNLLKASFAQTPPDKRGSLRKHGPTPVPTQILLRVRALAEKQSQVPPVSKAIREGSRTVNESRCGFL